MVGKCGSINSWHTGPDPSWVICIYIYPTYPWDAPTSNPPQVHRTLLRLLSLATGRKLLQTLSHACVAQRKDSHLGRPAFFRWKCRSNSRAFISIWGYLRYTDYSTDWQLLLFLHRDRILSILQYILRSEVLDLWGIYNTTCTSFSIMLIYNDVWANIDINHCHPPSTTMKHDCIHHY